MACNGGRRVGGSGGEAPPDAGEVFKIFVKKSMKNVQFLKKFQENFAIFSKFFKILSNFWRKFGQKFRNMHLWGFGGRSLSDASEFMEILVGKINGNLQFLDSSNGNFAIFS